jgi:hypothetical protein
MSPISFTFGSGSLSPHLDAYVALIPSGLIGREQLFDSLGTQLRFPDYFGRNWNALSDCFRDFHWIDDRVVIIVHVDLPVLGEEDLATYLDVLDQAAKDWKPGEEHELIVLFPRASQQRITKHGFQMPE